MKVLILGKTGQVSLALQQLFEEKKIDCVVLDRKIIDFSNINELEERLKRYHDQDYVINTVAYTQVEDAQRNVELADKINNQAVGALNKITQKNKQVLFHLSTDYVFDGVSHTPYKESDVPKPLNIYGQTKYLGEQAINNPKHLILRTSWVFGRGGNHFVKTMVRLLLTRKYIEVVEDQVGCPTSTADIARVIGEMIQKIARNDMPFGLYHYSGDGVVSWYRFACEIKVCLQYIRPKEQLANIHPIDSIDYPTSAKRPNNVLLDTAKIEHVGIKRRSWREDISDVVVDSLDAFKKESNKKGTCNV